MGANLSTFSPYIPVARREEQWWLEAQLRAKRNDVTQEGRRIHDLGYILKRDFCLPLYEHRYGHTTDNVDEAIAVAKFLPGIFELSEWIMLGAQYERNGRQIFDVSSNLLDLFEHTDFGDATFEGWRPPYNAFYLHFGDRTAKQPFKIWSSVEYLDGAFVATQPTVAGGDCLTVGLSMRCEDGTLPLSPGYVVQIHPSELSLPVAEAIAAASAHIKLPHDIGSDRDPNYVAAVKDIYVEYAEHAARVFRESIQLIFNALFYLESPDKRYEGEPGRGSPQAIIDQWHRDPSRRHKLRSHLTKDGYAVVYMVAESNLSVEAGDKTERSLAMHWRRGHWRMQRFGAGLLQVKRLWIKPVFVNKDKGGGEIVEGHIYRTPAAKESPDNGDP